MHQDPEHENYDDDEYKYYPQYNDYGYPMNSKKFDIDWAAWELWLSDALKEIVQENPSTWSFGYKSNASKKINCNNTKKDSLGDKHFIYLGSNGHDEAIWKKKFFVLNKLEQDYKNHISSNAAHFLRQPNYYKSMFDILN